MAAGLSGHSIIHEDLDDLDGRLVVPMTDAGMESREDVLRELRDATYELEATECPCGHAGNDVVLATVDRYRLPHRTVLCMWCGLSRSDPALSNRAAAEFYRDHYRAIYERPGHDAESLFAVHRKEALARFDYVRRYGGSRRPPRVLEIGCGAGWNLLPFAEAGCEVSGYDLNPDYLRAGRRRGLRLEEGDSEECFRVGRRYDLVILSHVLEHVRDPVALLDGVRNVLDPDGCLYVEVPSILRVRPPAIKYFQSAHLYSFCRPTLRSMMGVAGYEEVTSSRLVMSLWRAGGGGRTAIPPRPVLSRLIVRQLRRATRAFDRMNLLDKVACRVLEVAVS